MSCCNEAEEFHWSLHLERKVELPRQQHKHTVHIDFHVEKKNLDFLERNILDMCETVRFMKHAWVGEF